jgi:hypothetical protein
MIIKYNVICTMFYLTYRILQLVNQFDEPAARMYHIYSGNMTFKGCNIP